MALAVSICHSPVRTPVHAWHPFTFEPDAMTMTRLNANDQEIDTR